MGQDQSTEASKPLKNLIIKSHNTVFKISEIDRSTTISSFLSTLNNLLPSSSPIIGIQTSHSSECLNYWLSLPEQTLQPLHNNEVLTAIHYTRVPLKINLSSFEILKIIGKGNYSVVTQVRKRDTGLIYALKSIEKQQILKENLKKHLYAEREILSSISSPFIAKLNWAFQSKQKLHLVMDFYPGGELFYHLRNIRHFTEDQARFYFSEILVGLEALHSHNIAYRDLKPENVVIDLEGHIRLTDFGLSKLNMTGSSMSFCGSPEYMCPEVLSGSGHSKMVDYYCLGALVYEMLCGFPPYYDRDLKKIYAKILNEPLSVPDGLSKAAQALLKGLMNKNPEERLGSGGISEIFNHPWCRNIDWDKIRSKETKPPFAPNFQNSNFDKFSMDTMIPKSFFSDTEAEDDEFDKFDYRLESSRGDISKFCFERSAKLKLQPHRRFDARSSLQYTKSPMMSPQWSTDRSLLLCPEDTMISPTTNQNLLNPMRTSSRFKFYSPCNSPISSCITQDSISISETPVKTLHISNKRAIFNNFLRENEDQVRKSIEIYTSPRAKRKIISNHKNFE